MVQSNPAKSFTYERHKPEETTLYKLVAANWLSFKEQVVLDAGYPLPDFVIKEFDEYLRCGILAHGFLRAKCESCSRAEAAILLIDAAEGVCENSRRHGLLMSMLGVRQIIVAVNKMDLVQYNQAVYDKICAEYAQYLQRLGIKPIAFVPIAAVHGEGLLTPSPLMPWFRGQSLLQYLDGLEKEDDKLQKPFRMFLQDVYKFTAAGDQRRLFAGRPDSGSLRAGDEIIFQPSRKKSVIQNVEFFGSAGSRSLQAGLCGSVTLKEQVYVQRGELVCRLNERQPEVSSLIRVNLFWMGRRALRQGQTYLFKIGTNKVSCQIAEIAHILDSQTAGNKIKADCVQRHEVAELTLSLSKPIAFDLHSQMEATSRFVIVDDFEISGGGIIRESLPDPLKSSRESLHKREINFIRGAIDPAERMERFGQKPTLILFTGSDPSLYQEAARQVELSLFQRGRAVYFLGMGTVKYGLDIDLQDQENTRPEHLRRLAELTYLLLDAGLLVLVTARDLSVAEVTQIDLLTENFDIITVTVNGPALRAGDLSVLSADLELLPDLVQKALLERQ